ncbi:pyridoxamine 5'-phosphate oxidase family protein [Streptomyces boninensis]|uniref:pyridoxamine 5'-phosphate oxidase family protein n=1 Tax=Streptomyces boninensis TaxID=2039455 RepID=UPI003B228BEC
MQQLTHSEALSLVCEGAVGRIAFQHQAIPYTAADTHVLRADTLLLRSHGEPAFTPEGQPQVVVFETDNIDPANRTGWSVNIVGHANEAIFTGFPKVPQIVRTGAHLIFRTPSRRRLRVFTELTDGSYLSVLPSQRPMPAAAIQGSCGEFEG